MDSYRTKILCNLGTPRPSSGHHYWLIHGKHVRQLSVDMTADLVDMSVDISLPGVSPHEKLADMLTKVSVDSVGHCVDC